MEPTHVLVALDGSPLAKKALKHALAVFDCQITVLSISSSFEAAMSEGTVLERDQKRKEETAQHTAQLLADAQSAIANAPQDVETVVKTGSPADVILSYTEETDVDHIVMGGHGGDSGRLTRRLLGTVSTAVVGEAPVSVTVVR